MQMAKRLACHHVPQNRHLQAISERLPVTSPTALKQLNDEMKEDPSLYANVVNFPYYILSSNFCLGLKSGLEGGTSGS